MIRLVQRLRGMSAPELRFRVRAAARTRAQRLLVFTRGSRWDRRAILRVLSPGSLDSGARAAATRGDWSVVETALRRHISERGSLYVLDFHGAQAIRTAVSRHIPGAAANAAEAADHIVNGRFALLGFEGLSFANAGAAIDWHFDPVHRARAPERFWADVPYLDPGCGDHKIIWELNRHQYFQALGRAYWLTGDSRYADTLIAHFEDWLAANPPLVGVNWASMLELGLRSLSWLWAMHCLLAGTGDGGEHPPAARDRNPGPPWLLDMFVGLDRQLTHVEEHLSYYFSPNTHLTGEALALYVTGVALPELRRATRWRDLGEHILLRELDRQVFADGGHAERSPHYHRYTLDFYLLALLTSEIAGRCDAAARFRRAVGALADYLAAIADDSGRIPLIGDDDGGMLWPMTGRDPRDVRDSLTLASVVLDRPELARWGVAEEPIWLTRAAEADSLPPASRGPAVSRLPGSMATVHTRAFPDSGYVVMRTARKDHLVFDAGAHGYLNGGHAHADALSLTLALEGRLFLIDPGTGLYANVEIRDRMRGAGSHNTMTLDGRPLAEPGGPFHWKTRADARLAAWRSTPACGWAEGYHDAYAPVRLRRSIVSGGDSGWLVFDEIVAEGSHTLAGHWHFDPAWQVDREGGHRLHLRHPDGTDAWLLHERGDVSLMRGDRESGLGWCSPRYGVVSTTWTARIVQTTSGASSTVTWLGTGAPGRPPALERVQVRADARIAAIATEVAHADGSVVTLLRPGDWAERTGRSAETADCHTDARLLQVVRREDGRIRMTIADGATVTQRVAPMLAVNCDRLVPALELSIRGGTLDLWAPAPPSGLRLSGPALAGVRSVRLNERRHELLAPPAERLTLVSSDWGDPVRAGRLTSGPRPVDREDEVSLVPEHAAS